MRPAQRKGDGPLSGTNTGQARVVGAVGGERKATGGLCLDAEEHGRPQHETAVCAGPGSSGVLYLRAATSKLPWKDKMATLMVGTCGHRGTVG